MSAPEPATTRTLHAPTNDFSTVSAWVFDLDNTLYPRTCQLFAQIDVLITKYVMAVTGLTHDPAKRLQKDWYRDYGTTLNGLMHLHGTDPTDYLRTVHDIDYASVARDPSLTGALKALPGKKYVFTNADSGHAKAVLERLGGGRMSLTAFLTSSRQTTRPNRMPPPMRPFSRPSILRPSKPRCSRIWRKTCWCPTKGA